MNRTNKPTYDLSDAEKRDLAQLIQQGKPLPDKYRFILFEDKREVELVWNGKTREVCTAILPFQTLEHVDEPRKEAPESPQFGLFDTRGRQLKGWTNKLIWGDNKLILSSLKSGALRRQIEDAGGLKLIYIDPPFDVGADFSMDIEIGGETFHKEPNLLEQIAYRDTWGRGADSFIAMIYERLVLMRDLLAEDGSIFVHCDFRVNSYVRLCLDEVFGKDKIKNEIIWKYSGGRLGRQFFGRKHDNIYWFSKSDEWQFFPDRIRDEYAEATKERFSSTIRNIRDGKDFGEQSLNPEGKHPEDVFRISIEAPSSNNRTGYPTQKPEPLIEKIILGCSQEGDLIADFFVGSGTTAAVAEKLGRRWIGTDLGKFSIHATRKRLIGVQREQENAGKPFRAFEVLNLGRYERHAYLNIGGRLSPDQREQALAQKEQEFRDLILRAYKAQPLDGDAFFHGKNAGRLVVVGPINLPVGRLFVEEVITECRKRGATRADMLAFEFEMGLFPAVLDEAKAKGIDLAPKYIPAEVFDRRAVDRGQVVFHDISFVEATPRYNNKDKFTVQIELTDFSVYYTQGAAEAAAANLKNGKSQIVCEQGQLIKVTKDKEGIVKRETLTKNWTDWIDYWAVDFDYESRKEIIKVPVDAGEDGVLPGFEGPQSGLPLEFEEKWTGGYIFENEWQSFRTRKNRELELIAAPHTYTRAGRYTVAVKVIDIFGNDTMVLVPVNVG